MDHLHIKFSISSIIKPCVTSDVSILITKFYSKIITTIILLSTAFTPVLIIITTQFSNFINFFEINLTNFVNFNSF